MHFASQSAATLQRLVLRLAVLVVFALVWPSSDVSLATGILCVLLAAGCLAGAFVYREPILGCVLNRWHETFVLLVIGLILLGKR